MNEIILILSLIFEFGAVLAAYRFFGKAGLFAMTVFCTIVANIEVMTLVDAFGISQTPGNILFAASFVITDILSENEGKKEANKAAYIGIFVSVLFIFVSQSWMHYIPAADDTVMGAMKTLFKNTPRVMLVSFAVYAIVQLFDVWLYHKLWEATSKKCGDNKKYLWLRNCGATMISQLINAVLFTFGAFWGRYSLSTLAGICLSSYAVFAVTSLFDTPIVYLARYMKKKYSL